MNDLYSQKSNDRPAVECLGLKFVDDDARREHFLRVLESKLKDPQFRSVEGFPKASDAAILAMSDPPYYTACPNPFMEEFVRRYGQQYDPTVHYKREPMAVDVSVGKTDAVYKAHAYHTKVPHLAIVPSILHYTIPGDIVLDSFGGSGMTGVAVQWCATPPELYRREIELECKQAGRSKPLWGPRRVLLNDLSPAATFMASNYNLPVNAVDFLEAGRRLLTEVETELGWMYETLHTDGKTKGRIEFTVWSEVFTCPECAGEVNFIEEALDKETERVRDVFPCPHCTSELSKDRLERVLETRPDPADGKPWKRVKFSPAIVSYTVDGQRYQKHPDASDLALIKRIDELPLPSCVPRAAFPIEQMYHGSRIAPKGFTHVHHLYLPRAAQAIGLMWERANAESDRRTRQMLLFMVEQGIRNFSMLNAFEPLAFSQNARGQKGLYYVPSQHSEVAPWYFFNGKLKGIAKAINSFSAADSFAAISTGSATNVPVPANTVDYVFTDPPFGENIFYADLNFMVEAWHGVTTDSRPEAIIDRFKHKALPEYQHLMQKCFEEYYRVLKPGRWMTVVFSNSKAAVWNAIQVALQQAGFVVAEVTALDKGQGSYRQVTSATAVKQDLVISAYKPNGGLEERFARRGPSAETAWDFVETHLKQLPVVKVAQGTPPELVTVVERDARRIYDRMASWFIRHGNLVPVSTPEFLAEVPQRYRVVDGMAFLPDQLVEYEKARAQIPQIKQAELFISDERSAIDWLTAFLQKRPSTRSEVHTEYIPQIGAAKKKGEVIPELDQLLKDNFLKYDGKGDVPAQIANWLSKNFHEFRGMSRDQPALVAKAKERWYVPDPNKAQDLEKKRDEALLRDFEGYVGATGRKLKEFRLEVLRAGFKAAWAKKDYATIIKVAQKLPEEALQEDEKLLTLYDLALTRTEVGG